MSERVFILGLGCQKCGTSWLHSYLRQAPNFDGGFRKEYHIWDAIDTQGQRHLYLSWFKGFLGSRPDIRRFRMQRTPSYYFDFFSSLLNEKKTITADITPSYSDLSIERLVFLRDGFAKKSMVVKPIILLRNPIDRIKSAVRFNMNSGKQNVGFDTYETDFSTALSQYYTSRHCILRTRYDLIISRAVEVFGAKDIYVGIYENMFERANIEALSSFIGIEPNFEFSNVVVNKTKGSIDCDPELEYRIRRAYAEVYDYCYDRLPQTRQLWT